MAKRRNNKTALGRTKPVKLSSNVRTVKPKVTWEIALLEDKFREGLQRTQQTQEKLRRAIIIAEDVYEPLRYALYETYKDTILINAHTRSLIANRVNRLVQLEFDMVDINGEADAGVTDMIKKKWFNDLREAFIQTKMWGHSLLQIKGIVNNEITEIGLIPREYVSPEAGLILAVEDNGQWVWDYTQLKGRDFRDPSNIENDLLIEIGKRNDLGLLDTISIYAIWQKVGFQHWAILVEKYGLPLLLGMIASNDADAINTMFDALGEMTSDGSTVLTGQDDIKVLETDSLGASNPDFFDKLVAACNGEISKLLLGATGITDGLTNGTAQSSGIMQLQLDTIAKADLIDYEFFYNEDVMPKLKYLNILPDGYTLKFRTPERLIHLTNKATLDKSVAELALMNWDLETLKDVYGFIPQHKDVLNSNIQIIGASNEEKK